MARNRKKTIGPEDLIGAPIGFCLAVFCLSPVLAIGGALLSMAFVALALWAVLLTGLASGPVMLAVTVLFTGVTAMAWAATGGFSALALIANRE